MPVRLAVPRNPWRARELLACLALLVLAGCATGAPAGRPVPLDTGGGGPAAMPLHVVQGRLVEVDEFEVLLLRAGLDDSNLLPVREADFTPTVLALGGLSFRPGESLAALSQLPQGVAALVLHSPEYLERFQLMTRGEQIRALSRLSVTVLATYGAAAGTTRTIASVGGGLESLSVPVLALSADGALVLQRAVVPVGRAVSVLSGGPGAAVVLHMANQSVRGQGGGAGRAARVQGPGQWSPVKGSMSRRAARYQEQISGCPVDESYTVRGVRFDGYKDGVLLEAKGLGYANKFLGDLSPEPWFTKGARNLVGQAQRQLKAAKGTPIHWHVAEAKAANAIRELFKKNHVQGIEVVHTLAIP